METVKRESECVDGDSEERERECMDGDSEERVGVHGSEESEGVQVND